MNNPMPLQINEILKEISLIKGGTGITTNNEISIDMFFNWYFTAERKHAILNIIIESLGKEKEVLILI